MLTFDGFSVVIVAEGEHNLNHLPMVQVQYVGSWKHNVREWVYRENLKTTA